MSDEAPNPTYTLEHSPTGCYKDSPNGPIRVAVEGVTIRPELLRFAKAMEEKLQENEHKGGWDHCSLGYLFQRLEDEIKEAKDAAQDLTAHVWASEAGDPVSELDELGEALMGEFADVGNFAMMLFEKTRSKAIGGL